MEAVAAVGVAAAAAQFLDFSTKIIALCKEIRDSSTGSTEANAELTKSVKQLKEIQEPLRQAGNTSSSTYRQLVRAVQECSRVANELLQLLEDISEVARKSFGPMRSAFRAMKERKTVEKLQKRLMDCQEKFRVALTIDIRQSVAESLEKQGKSSDTLQNIMLPELRQLRTDLSASYTIMHDQLQDLGRNLTSSCEIVQRRMLHLELKQQATSTTLVHGHSELNSRFNRKFGQASKSAAHKDFYASLFFDDMFTRQQSIKPRQTATYEWVFTGQSPYDRDKYSARSIARDEELRGKILGWLKNDQTLFWMTGKAGSGKTSLMSFLEGDKRTQEALAVWARTQRIYTFSFFFWRPGSVMQRSVSGLLRTILYQITKAKPTIVDMVISRSPSLHYSNWTEAKLLDALKRALTSFGSERVFLLIDGLDEFEGDYGRLLDIILSMQLGTRIKICISSRPETAIVNRLVKRPSIRLEDLNHHDIKEYVGGQFERYRAALTQLIKDVVGRAEGIFLWAVLVCKSLVSGVEAGDCESVLRRRLDSVPSGIKDLISHMFSNIDGVHRENVSTYFDLMELQRDLEAPPPSVALVTVIMHEGPYHSLQHFIDDCEKMEQRILAQSKGLIRIEKSRYDFYASTSQQMAFVDVATGSIRRGMLTDNDFRCVLDYTACDLSWVHRSAYDCMFGESGDPSASHRKPADQSALAKKVIAAYKWLALHVPVTERRLDRLPSLGCFLDDMAKLALRNRSLTEEVHQAFDEIHYSLCLFMSGSGIPISKGLAPTNNVWEEPGTSLDQRTQFRLFWQGVARLDSYLLSRIDLIEKTVHANTIYFDVLNWLDIVSTPELDPKSRAPARMIVDRLQNLWTRRPRQECRTNIIISRDCWMGVATPVVLSWTGSGNDSISEAELLVSFGTRPVSTFEDILRSQTQVDAFPANRIGFDARLIWFVDTMRLFKARLNGPLNPTTSRQPLQILLSANHIFYGHRTKFPETFRYSQAVLRLFCLRRAGRYRRRLLFTGCDATHLDLSATLTAHLLSLSEDDQGVTVNEEVEFAKVKQFELRLTGTALQYEECLQMITQEAWDNVNEQLDAWQQLYLLACVKTSFISYWNSGDSMSCNKRLSGLESESESKSGSESK
jgi:hypothetical protein